MQVLNIIQRDPESPFPSLPHGNILYNCGSDIDTATTHNTRISTGCLTVPCYSLTDFPFDGFPL